MLARRRRRGVLGGAVALVVGLFLLLSASPAAAATVYGTLASGDQTSPRGTLCDAWTLPGVGAGTWVTINLNNNGLSDPYLYVFNGSGGVVAQNDDYNGLNSYIGITWQSGYYIGAAAYGGSGGYALITNVGTPSASSLSCRGVVAKQNQTITFNNPGTRQYRPTFTVSASASSGLTVTLTSNTTGICSVSGFTVTPQNVGTCTITASQGGDGTWNAASNVSQSFSITKADQSTTFAALSNRTYSPTAFAVSATTSSGLPATFSSLTTSLCTVSGSNVTMLAEGTCTIRASQSGDTLWNAAADIDRSFAISKASQTITFNNPGARIFSTAPFTVAPTSTSALAVTVTSRTTGVCTVSGFSVTMVSVGTCTLQASQAGNTQYLPAVNVDQSFSISKTDQTITFGSLAAKTYGDADFTVSATASSGLTVSFSSSTTAVCTVSTRTVSIVAAGTCTISANQAGDAFYNPATAVSQSFTVARKTVTASATLASRPYNGGRSAGALTLGSLVGLVPGESLILSATASDYASASVGTRSSTISYTLSDGSGGGRAANYSISSVTVNGEITQRQLTVTATSISRRTDAASPTFTISTSGLVAGESVSGTTYTFLGTGSTSYASSTTVPSATTVGTYQVTPSALVLTSPASASNYDITYVAGSYAVTIGAATQLVRNVATLSAASGSTFTTQPVITIQDAGGNTVTTGADSAQVVTATVSGDGTLIGTRTATAFEGVARFTNLGITGSSSTTYTITYSATLNGVSRSVTQTVQPTFGTASALRIRTSAATARAGVAFATQPVVEIVDSVGNVVTSSSARVSLTVSDGGTLSGTTTVTASSGVATFSGVSLAGTVTTNGSPVYALTFAASGLTSATQSNLSLSAGVASRLSLSDGVSGSESGAVFSTQPKVTVLDAYGNAVTQANNTITATLTQVNSTGTLVGGLSGQTSVSSDGLQARFMRGSLSSIRATKGVAITTATSGYCLGGTVSNLDYSWGSGGPGGTCGSDLFAGYWSGYITSPVSKTVTFNVSVDDGFYMTINDTMVIDTWVDQGSATYNASGTFAMTANTEYPIKIWFYENGGGAAARLFWNANVSNTTQVVPTSAFAGAPGPSVTATATTASTGQATFSGIGVNGLVGTTYTITYSATVDGQTLTTTRQDVLITSGLPRSIRIDRAPAGAVNGSALTTQPIVTLLDSAGNPITLASGKSVTLTASIPGMTATGNTATVTSASNGQATFSGLTFTGTSGAKTLTFAATASTDTNVQAAITANSVSSVTSALTINPGPAVGLVIRTNSSTSLASGATLSTQPVIAVVDASGNTVTTSSATVTASIADGPAGGVLLGTAAQQAVAGVVTYSGLGIRGTTGTYQLSFAGNVDADADLESVAQNSATGSDERISVTYGAAAKLVLANSMSGVTAASGAAFSTQPVVQVQDSAGNVVANSTASITASVSTGATLVGTATANAASGVRTFSGLGISGTNLTTYTMTYSSSGLTSVTHTVQASTGAATKIALTTAAVGNQAGQAFTTQPRISVLDSGNNVVTSSSAQVTATVSSGGTLVGTTTATAGAGATPGVAEFADLGISGTAGTTYTVTYSSGSLATLTQSIVVRAGPAAKLTLTQSSSTSVASGSAFAQQPIVRVEDSAGNLVTTSTDLVTATVASGPSGSAFIGTASVYPTNGVVTFSGLGLRGTAGSYSLRFTSGSLTAATQTSAVSVTFGAAAKLVVSNPMAGASSGSGAAFGTPPTIQVQDSAGNVVTNSTVSITASVSAGATLVGTSSGTATSGSRTFTGLGINGTSGMTYTVTYSSSGLTSATDTVQASTGAATKLALTTASVGDQAGQAFTTQPVVSILDSGNNVVTSSGATVTASVSSGGTIVGTAAVAANSGVVTYGATAGTADDLGISGTAGSTYTVTYASGSLTSVSQTIVVRAGPAAKLTVSQSSSTSVASGSAFAQQPIVRVEDSAGNLVTTSADLVTATIVAGSPDGALIGTTARYPTNGVVTFSGLGIRGVAGSYSMRFTSGSLTAVTQSSTVSVTFGPAAKVVVTNAASVAAGSAASGAALGVAPIVQIQDVSGNVVTSATPTISVAVSDGGTISGTTSKAAVSGAATFDAVTLSGTAGRDYTLTYTATVNSVALTPATHAVSVSTGVARKLAINQASAGSTSGAAFSTQPWISILDSGNNVVTTATNQVTATVTLGTGSAGGTLVGTTAVTGASGIAKFTNLGISGSAGTPHTITYSAAGLTSVTQSITPTVGAPTQLVVTTAPDASADGSAGNVRAGLAFGRQPVIEIRDGAGNKVTTSTARVTATINSGSLVGNTTADAVAGVATFANLGASGTAGSGYTITYTAALDGTARITTSSLTVVAGTAVRLSLNRSAAATVNAGVVIPAASQPIVHFLDSAGNVVNNGLSSTVTASISAGGTLTGHQVSASDGSVEFASLTASGVTGTYTLTYSSPGVTPTSQSIEIAPGDPYKIVIEPAAKNLRVASGTPVNMSSSVKVADRAGNIVPVSGSNKLTMTATALTQSSPSDACASPSTSVNNDTGLTEVTIKVSNGAGLTDGGCKWRVPLGVTQLRIAAVGGGGGGGSDGGSGGGGGELRQGSVSVTEGADLTVIVGAGGAGGGYVEGGWGVSGSDTTVSGTGVSFTAKGGTRGGGWGGSPTFNQGYNYTPGGTGGTGGSGGTGSDGGAGGRGPESSNHCPSSGYNQGLAGSSGPALSTSLFSAATRFGGGGGGGIETEVGTYASDIEGAAGGSGVGGRGARYNGSTKKGDGGSPLLDAQADTGGGGGAGIACGPGSLNSATNGTRTNGGNGANGVVIIAYATTNADVNLKVSATSETGSSGSTQANLSSGLLSLSTLRLDGKARSDYQVVYSGTVNYNGTNYSLQTDTQSVTLTAGTPASLNVSTAASGSVAGTAFRVQPTVALRDSSGNLVAGATNQVSVALSGAPAGTTLGGTTTVTPVDGVARFTDLKIDGAVGTYTLTYSTAGVTSATQSVTVTHGAATSLTISRNSATTLAAGGVFATSAQPQVTVVDAFGNTVTTSDATVTASLDTDSASGTLTGTLTRRAVDGVVTFTDLGITGATGTYRLKFSADVTTATSGDESVSQSDAQRVTVSAGTPTNLVLTTTAPTSVASGAAFASANQPRLEIRDAYGNLTSSTASVTATLTRIDLDGSPTGVLVGGDSTTAKMATASAGVAMFSGLGITGTKDQTYRITFSSTGLSDVTMDVAVTAGAATQLAIIREAGDARVGLNVGVAPIVELRDSGNNPVASSGVRISTSISTGATVTTLGSFDDTGATGRVTLSTLAFGGTATENGAPYSVTYASTGLTSVTQSLTLRTGNVAGLTVSRGAGNVAKSGSTFTRSATVTLGDPSENAITQATGLVTATVTSGSGTLLGTTVKPLVAGVATFDDLGIEGAAGSYTITYSATFLGTTYTKNESISVIAGDPVRITLTTPAVGTAVGAAFSTQPKLTFTDRAGNTAASTDYVEVSVQQIDVDGTLTGTLSGTTRRQATAGVVDFGGGTPADLTLVGKVGQTYRLSYTVVNSSGVANADYSPIVQDVTVTAGTATSLVLTTEAAGAVNGSVFTTQPRLEVRDVGGNVATGATGSVTLDVTAGPSGYASALACATTSGCTSVPLSSGVVTFSDLKLTGLVGTYTLRASVSGLTTTQSVVVTAGEATKLVLGTAPAGAASDSAFATQPVVRITDASGNVVSSASTTVTVASDKGTLTGATSVPTVAGIATFSDLGLTGLTTQNPHVLTFASSGDGYPSVTSSVDLQAGDPVAVSLTTSAGGTAVGAAFSPQPKLTFTDRAGNTATSTDYVEVTVQQIDVDGTLTGTLSGTTRRQAAAGVVDFGVAPSAGITLVGKVGQTYRLTYTVVDSSGNANTAYSPIVQSVTVTPGAATSLVLTTEAAGAAAGASLATQPRLEVRDVAGNVATSTSGTVTLSITGGPTGYATALGCVTGSGCQSVALSSGVASFANLKLSGLVGTYDLSYSVGGLTATQQVDVVPGAATKLVVGTAPAGAASGSDFTTQPVVRVTDASGNVVASANTTVTVSSNKGSLIGATSIPTVAGIATFEGLGISGLTTQNPHVLTFSSTGGTYSAATSSIDVTPGPAARLSVDAPTTARAGEAFASQPEVSVLDAGGNVVTSSTATITATISTGADLYGTSNPIVSDGIAAAASGGVARFSDLAIYGGSGSSYVVTFSTNGLASVSKTVSLSSGPLAELGIAQPAAGARAGVQLDTMPTIQLFDVAGNRIASEGVEVTAAITPITVDAVSTGSLEGTTTVETDENGLATFTNLKVNGALGREYTLTYSVATAGVSSVSQTVVTQVGPASKLAFARQPSSGVASGAALSTQPIVQVQDAAGNPLPSSTAPVAVSVQRKIVEGGVTTLVAGGSVAYTAPSTTGGLATFSDLSVSGLSGSSYRLSFTSSGLTAATFDVSMSTGAATALAITTNTGAGFTAPSGNEFSSDVVVEVRDSGGNVVISDAEVTATISCVSAGAVTCSGAILNGNVTATASSGVAVFTSLGVTGTSGHAPTVTFSVPGLASASFTPTISAGSAARLTVVRSGATAPSGAAFGVSPQVAIEDAGGNRVTSGAAASLVITASVTQVNVAGSPTGELVTSSGSPATSSLTATASSGLATFANLGLTGTKDVAYVVTYSAGSLSGSETLTVSTGPAVSLALTTESIGSASGAAFSTQPVITLRDSGGNTVTASTDSVTATVALAAGGVGGSLVGTSRVTLSSGVATFTNLGLNGMSGTPYRITYTLTTGSGTPIAGVATTSQNVTATVGAPASIALTTSAADAVSGLAFGTQPIVTVRDSGGNTVTSSTMEVTATLTAGAAGGLVNGGATPASVTVNAVDGVASFTQLGLTGSVSQAYTLTFTSASLSGDGASVSQTGISVAPGSAAEFGVSTGAGTQAPSGSAFTIQPVVTIRDAQGNTVTSSTARVAAAITQIGGKGSLVGTTFADAVNGVATFANLGITGTAGSAYTVTFSVAGLADQTTTYTVSTGPATQLALTRESVGTTAGMAFTTQPQVTVRDSGGNTVTSYSTAITASITRRTVDGSLTGELVGATTATPTAGTATFASVGIGGITGVEYTITYSSGGLTPATQSVAPTAGPAARLALTRSSSGTVAGREFTVQPRLRVLDAYGNTVTTSTDVVTASVSQGATLIGTAARNAVDGTIAYTNLGVRGAANTTYTLSYTLAGFAPVTESVALVAGPAYRLTLRTLASGAASGAAFTTQPVLEVKDSSGNLVTSSTATVTATITQVLGSGTLTGAATATASGGVVTFTNLGINGLAGTSYLVTFSSTGLLQEQQTIVLGLGAPANLSLVQQSVGTASGAAFVVQPRVAIVDAGGNIVTTSSAAVLASVTQVPVGGELTGALVGTSSQAAASGIATFANLGISGRNTTAYTVSYSVPSLPTLAAVTQTITPTTGAAASLRLTTSAKLTSGSVDNIVVSGAVFGVQPQITVVDSGGNRVTSYNDAITASVVGTGGALVGSRSRNAISGIGTFTDLGLSGVTGTTYTVSFGASGVASVAQELGVIDSLPGSVPVFSAPVSTEDGVRLTITNHDPTFTYDAVTSVGARAVVGTTGVVLVSGVQADTPFTLIVSSSKTNHRTESASIVGRSLPGLGLIPVVGAATPTVDGFTATITNYSTEFAWTVSTSSGRGAVTSSGVLTVTGASPSTAVTATITTSRLGHTSRSFTTGSVTTLSRALTPTIAATTRTQGGFTTSITNFDPAYSYAVTVSSGGTVTLNNATGAITVSGLSDGTLATVLVVTSRATYADGSAAVQGQALSAALAPVLADPVATSTGFTVDVANYDAAYTWTPSVTAGSVTLAATSATTARATVTLATGVDATLTVATSRTGYRAGSATKDFRWTEGLRAIFGSATSTTGGFTVPVTNHSADYSWSVSATSGTATINNVGLVTVTGMTGTASTVTVSTRRTGYTSLGATFTYATTPGIVATFGTPTSTVDGFTVAITNHDNAYTWSGTATQGGSVAISGAGLITVSGLQPGTSSTVTVLSNRSGYSTGVATVTGASANAAALTPAFGAVTRTEEGFTVDITNYSADYRWSAEVTSGDTAGIAVVDEGALTVSSVTPGQSATVTVTAQRTGYDTGTATVSGTALTGGALIPVFSRSSATATGFSVPITNYNAAFTWSATATAGATASVSAGTVTVTGLTEGVSSTVTVTATRSGRADGSSSFTGAALTGSNNTLTPPLRPAFGTPTGTADGFRVRITNYDSSYTWSGVTSRNATVTIAAGVATVSGVAAGRSDTLYVTTNKAGSATGSASVNGTALATGARPANLLSAGTVGTLCSTSSPGGEGVTSVNDLSATTKFSCLHAASGAVTNYTPNSAGFYTGNLGSYVLTSVTFTSAADAPERDPLTFTLWGCAQQNANCSVIVSDARTELSTVRGEDKEIALRNTRAFSFYKLTFGSVRGTSHALQVAEVSFAGSSGLLSGLVPTFGTQTPETNRATVPITNFSALYDWSLAVTDGGRASLDRNTGVITVANVNPASTVTLTVTTRREGYSTETANIPVTTTSGAALVPNLSTVRPTTTGASARIENYDTPGFTWSAMTTSGGVAVGTTTIGTDGFVRVTGVPAGTGITITVTTTRANFATGTNSVDTTVLSPAYVATFASPTRTSDGFTVQINDYATRVNSYEWTFAATAGGQVSVNDTGLVTVSNLGPGVTSTLTVTTRGTDLAPASATLVETSIAPARIPLFDTPAARVGATGFEAVITNFDAAFTWTVSATAGSANIVIDGSSATVVATDASATVTVSAARTGYVTGTATLRSTMTAALVPALAPPTVGASGFTVQITNYDAVAANWSVFLTPAGTVSISGSGLVTASGVPVGADAVLTVRTSFAGRHSGSSTTTVNLARATALTPAFASPLPFGGGFTVQVSNYSSDFSWTVSASSGAAASIDSEGLITVTGVSNAESTTLTVTTTREGYATGTATTTGSSRLSPALTPTLGAPEPTADGFTVAIVNYDTDYTWTAQVDNNGSIVISADGVVTVSGVPGFTQATAAITASRTGYASGTSTVAATSTAGTALVPQFGVSTSSASGYSVPLRNFDSRYTWSVTPSTNSGVTATIDASGVITVDMSGLSPTDATAYAGRLETITVRTTRIGFLDGAADFTAAARSQQSTAVTAFSVTNYVVSTGTATLTTATSHGFAVGNEVFISGVASGIDGVQTVSAVNAGARTFSFLTTVDDTPATTLSPAGAVRRNGDFSVDLTLNPARAAGDSRPDVGATINVPYSVAGDGTSFVGIPSMTEEADAGYRVVTVRATSPDGANVSELQDAIRILFDGGASNAVPVTSSDNGLTWTELPRLTSALLPAGQRHGYYRTDDGTIWIYSRHLTMFGMLAPQAVPVTVTAAAAQINVGSTTTATYSGGEGVGALSIASSTPSVCSVTQAGLVTGLSAGTCTLTATRTASGRFLDATGSTTLRIGSLVADSAPAAGNDVQTTPTTVPPATTPSTVPSVTRPSTTTPSTVPFVREDPTAELVRRIELAEEAIALPIPLEAVGRFVPGRPAVIILEDGTVLEATITRTTNDNGFTISTPDFTITVQAFRDDGSPAEIDPSGRVVVEETGTMRVSGEGFSPLTRVKAWMFSDPTSVGDVMSDAEGRVDALVPMPDGIGLGEHTVQLNGVTPVGGVRSVNVGVKLVEEIAANGAATGAEVENVDTSVMADTSALGTALTALAAVAALVGMAVLALAIARRPRRRTPQS